MAKLINFRCPENLEADIAKIGLEFYPKEIKDETKDRGYDLTTTMLAILRAGIDSITSQGLCLTEDKTERNTVSITSHKTEDITELQTAIAELQTKFESLENAKPSGDIEGKITDLVSKEEMNQRINPLADKINSLETAIADLITKKQFDKFEKFVYEFLEKTEDKTKKTVADTIPKIIQNELPLTSENDQPDQPIEAKESLPVDDIPLQDREKLFNDEMAKLSNLALGKIKDMATEEKIITLKNGTKYKPIKKDNRKTIWEKIKLVPVKISQPEKQK
jgi:hypothetical protein